MKHISLVGMLFVSLASTAQAQGMDINLKWGASGSHTELSSWDPLFNYEATITGCPSSYRIVLEIHHNGELRFCDSQIVINSAPTYSYVHPVCMLGWGLRPGDTVTFTLKILEIDSCQVLASHELIGDVTGP